MRVSSSRLEELMTAELTQLGVMKDSASHVSCALVEASLRGVDSHGINLYPYYCRAVEAGRINRRPNIKTIKREAATAVVDGDFGFGHHAGRVAMGQAMELAQEHGIAAVAVRDSSHFASAAYYGLHAARKGFVGFAFTNSDSLTKAFASPRAFFGTNPICFAVPMADEEPLCLDMATSTVPWNKVINHRRCSEPLPEGWAFDESGAPTTDPAAARTVSPVGGYKGFGLGMMVELLCSTLADGPDASQLGDMYENLSDRPSVSHFFMALDIARFLDPNRFRHRVREIAQSVRALPRLDKNEPVMVPGDPEKRAYTRRARLGIPMDEALYAQFLDLSEAFTHTVLP